MENWCYGVVLPFQIAVSAVCELRQRPAIGRRPETRLPLRDRAGAPGTTGAERWRGASH